jgi:hypothetical protein
MSEKIKRVLPRDDINDYKNKRYIHWTLFAVRDFAVR